MLSFKFCHRDTENTEVLFAAFGPFLFGQGELPDLGRAFLGVRCVVKFGVIEAGFPTCFFSCGCHFVPLFF